MSVTPETRVPPFGAISILALVKLAEQAVHAVAQWNAQRKLRNSLAGFSDRQLEDIGLNRADIPRLTGKS